SRDSRSVSICVRVRPAVTTAGAASRCRNEPRRSRGRRGALVRVWRLTPTRRRTGGEAVASGVVVTSVARPVSVRVLGAPAAVAPALPPPSGCGAHASSGDARTSSSAPLTATSVGGGRGRGLAPTSPRHLWVPGAREAGSAEPGVLADDVLVRPPAAEA